MKRSLFILIICMLSLPVTTRTALIQTELTYRLRNAKGMYSFVPFFGVGAGQVNLANGNLSFSRRLITRPGRAGFSADISIAYNSKIWDRDGDYMKITAPVGSVGLGWRIGFPTLVQGSSSYALVLLDGSSHEIVDLGGGVWKSVDSTYMLLDPASKIVTLKGGVKLIFGNTVGNTSYMTEMKDRNGNQITATYVAGTGNLSQVQDSLGVLANFVYSVDGFLQTIHSHGNPRLDINFSYYSYAVNPSLPPSFSIPYQVNELKPELYLIEVSGGNILLQQQFLYDNYGEMQMVKNYQIERYWNGSQWVVQGWTNDRFDYSYATLPFWDATYGSVEERVVSQALHNFTNPRAFSYTTDSSKSNPSAVSVTVSESNLSRYMTYNLSYTTSGRNWSDGLLQSLVSKTAPSPPPQQTLRTEETTWTQDNTSLTFPDNPRVTSSRVTLETGQSTHVEYSYTNDGTGNVRQVSQYGYSNELLSSTTTNYLYETNSSYVPPNLTNLPSSVSIANGSGTEVARAEYGYDAYSLTSYAGNIQNHDPAYSSSFTLRGNQTDVRRILKEDNNRPVATSNRYDITGNAVSSTDAKGNTTTVLYPSTWYYTLPQSTTNPLGHTTAFDWWQYGYLDTSVYPYVYVQFWNGDLKTTTDPNGAVTSYYYDYFGKKTQETTPTETKNFSYDYLDYMTTVADSSGYGYLTQTPTNLVDVQHTDPAGQNLEQTATYNSAGQVTSQSAPYRAGNNSFNTNTSYDVLGRKLAITLPTGGSVNYSYSGNTVTVTDPEGKRKKYTYNALGKVSTVTEEDSQGNLTVDTNYGYDTLGNLINISQGSQTRGFTYDSLGRLTSENHPESSTGIYSMIYSYDDNGNIVSKTDARSVVTTNAYDALNRPTGTTYSDGTPAATYSYDQTSSGLIGTITNGKGRQTSVWTSDNIGYSWSYDVVGRPIQQVASIDASQYPASYNYTDGGCGCPKKDLLSVTYPDNTTVSYTRDAAGRITGISSGSTQLVQSVAYNSPSGALTYILYGDNTHDSVNYDPYGRLSSIGLYSAPTSSVTLSIGGYTASNRIAQMTESSSYYDYDQEQFVTTTSSHAFAYDRWYRLSSATKTRNGTQLWNDSWTHDQYGNMLSVDKLGTTNDVTYSVDASTNRLISSTSSQGTTNYGFGSGGFLINDSQKSYTYGGQGLLKEVDRISDNAQLGIYRYDAMGRRVKKSWSYSDSGVQRTGSTIYIYGAAGELLAEYLNSTASNGTWETSTTDNLMMGAKTIGYWTRGTSQSGQIDRKGYLHRNHLGDVVMKTPQDFPPTSLPAFKEPFTSSGSYESEGVKDDSETGLRYNLARNYSQALSRWTTADSITPKLFDPQSLNKYAYVGNDPVNYVDRNGRNREKPDQQEGGRPNNPFQNPGMIWVEGDSAEDSGHWEPNPDYMPAESGSISQGGYLLPGKRQAYVDAALAYGLAERARRGDCAKFLNGVMSQLRGRVPAGFTIATLIDNIKHAQVNSRGLGESQIANTREGNTINLGGAAYSVGDYGRDLLSTLFHEGFHLASSGGSGGIGIAASLADERQLAKAAVSADNPDAEYPDKKGSSAINLEMFGRNCGGGWEPR